MKFLLVLLSVVVLFATAVPAVAGPGDPRLVNGILEWPRAVSNEPFIVVRGDDGVLYYVAVGAARHDASLTAGGRVAVLGLEGRSAHEINALGIGAGESVEAALGNLQGARPSPTVAAPPPPAASTLPAPAAAAPAAPSPNAAPRGRCAVDHQHTDAVACSIRGRVAATRAALDRRGDHAGRGAGIVDRRAPLDRDQRRGRVTRGTHADTALGRRPRCRRPLEPESKSRPHDHAGRTHSRLRHAGRDQVQGDGVLRSGHASLIPHVPEAAQPRTRSSTVS